MSARAWTFAPCAKENEAFRYPRGADGPADGRLVVDAMIEPEDGGILVIERIARRNEPTCCPSLERTTRYAYRDGEFQRQSGSVRRLPVARG